MKYAFIFLLSFFGLLWERFWNSFWPAVALVFFFSSLALLNVPLLFGLPWHLTLLAAFAVALAIAVLQTGSPFSFPRRADVERHMERISALDHRPLQALKDNPAEGLSEESLSLWRRHLQRASFALGDLKVYRAQTVVPAQDRWKLRYFALLFLVFALAAAQKDAPERLRLALAPDFAALMNKTPIALDLWVTPPDYTHEATTFLATSRQGLIAHEEAIAVPENSLLKLRLSGLRFGPHLNYAGQNYALAETTPRNFTLEVPLQKSGLLRLGNWFVRLGPWNINVLPDTAPEVSITKIEPTVHAATKITYQASDDHGIAKLTGIVTAEGKTYSFDIPPAHAAGEATHVEDLTAHPAAGLQATLTLEAVDAVGHATKSVSAPFVLPERQFENPTAARVIAQRKILLRENNIVANHSVAENLAGIAQNPALYNGDIVVYMSLAAAIKRLAYSNGDDSIDSIATLLWDVALRLEDSGLSLAQRDLHDTLQKLSQALGDKNATKEQLQDIIEELKKTMQQYVQSLAAELQQKMQQGQKMPALSPELARQFLKNLDVNKLLEQMRQLLQPNSREELQKLADNLKNSIDNFDMDKFGKMQQKQMQAMQALQNLQDIVHSQQSLFDKTNKTDDPADLKDQKQEQLDIRKQLGEALHKLGETGAPIPDNFANADQSMKGSAEALGKGRRDNALTEQKAALDEMQKGLDSTIKKMAEAMQQSLLSFGQDGGNYGEGFDPLGRPKSLSDDGSVKLPDEKEQRRVQQIIEELRHRSNEPNRTKVERDYIDRLLDQF